MTSDKCICVNELVVVAEFLNGLDARTQIDSVWRRRRVLAVGAALVLTLVDQHENPTLGGSLAGLVDHGAGLITLSHFLGLVALHLIVSFPSK